MLELFSRLAGQRESPPCFPLGTIVSAGTSSAIWQVVGTEFTWMSHGRQWLHHCRRLDEGRLFGCPDARCKSREGGYSSCPICSRSFRYTDLTPFTKNDLAWYVRHGFIAVDLLPNVEAGTDAGLWSLVQQLRLETLAPVDSV
jgi:hypothetical protein